MNIKIVNMSLITQILIGIDQLKPIPIFLFKKWNFLNSVICNW